MKTPAATSIAAGVEDSADLRVCPNSRCLRGASRAPRRSSGRTRRHLGDLRTCRRSCRRPSARRKAALERPIDAPFDLRRCFAHDLGDFRDDEELRTIEHALLAEREALRLGEERQALQDVSDIVDRAAAHFVGVVLEPSLPVLMVVDLAVAEQREEPLDFVVGDGAAKTDAVDVRDRHEYDRLVGDDAKVIETASGAENSFFFDAFDDPETMVRVDDLVTDFKRHGFPLSLSVAALYGRPRCVPAAL